MEVPISVQIQCLGKIMKEVCSLADINLLYMQLGTKQSLAL